MKTLGIHKSRKIHSLKIEIFIILNDLSNLRFYTKNMYKDLSIV